MSTLVTGGRGFVGRQLVDQLLAGGAKVVSYNRDFAVDTRDGLTVVQGELFDMPRLIETLRHHSVERIIHTAGQSHPGVDRKSTRLNSSHYGLSRMPSSA